MRAPCSARHHAAATGTEAPSKVIFIQKQELEAALELEPELDMELELKLEITTRRKGNGIEYGMRRTGTEKKTEMEWKWGKISGMFLFMYFSRNIHMHHLFLLLFCINFRLNYARISCQYSTPAAARRSQILPELPLCQHIGTARYAQ